MWQTFALTQQSWTDVLLPTPPLSPTKWPVGPSPVSLPTITIEAVHLSQASVDKQEANPSVFNQNRLGLQPWRSRLFTSLSSPFPTKGPPLSPNGSVNILNINQYQIKCIAPIVDMLSNDLSTCTCFYNYT
jgi:hypothetical protein